MGVKVLYREVKVAVVITVMGFVSFGNVCVGEGSDWRMCPCVAISYNTTSFHTLCMAGPAQASIYRGLLDALHVWWCLSDDDHGVCELQRRVTSTAICHDGDSGCDDGVDEGTFVVTRGFP